MSRTKIVCTIGPASESVDTLRSMIRSGMRIARINFSHGSHADHRGRIGNIRRAASEEKAVVAILGDLQGPKFRIGDIAAGQIELRPGEEVQLTLDAADGGGGRIHLPHEEIFAAIRTGNRLLLDDGQTELRVVEAGGRTIRCTAPNGGALSSRKGLAIPGVDLQVPSITEKDRADAEFAASENLDFLALSFVRRRRDLIELRRLLERLGAAPAIVAKIEKQEALDNFDEILAESDAVMVARGDLGVEIPPERVPFAQKDLIRRCNEGGVPVITATQMLNSMISNPRPTRAEASDVANAILDGTSAVMLSGETAAGRFPLESVRMLESIAACSEDHLPYEQWIYLARRARSQNTPMAISQATIEIAHELNAKAIVTSTSSGLTARWVASIRHRTPMVAITPDERVFRRLPLLWGVEPKLAPRYSTTDQMIAAAARAAVESGAAASGDTIVITSGIPPGTGQPTNMIQVHVIPG